MAAALRERHGGIGTPVVKLLGLPQVNPARAAHFLSPGQQSAHRADAVPYLICPMARAIGFQFLYLCVELIL